MGCHLPRCIHRVYSHILLSSASAEYASLLPSVCCCSVAPTAGATGGFAGGEKGLKQYIATGEVQLRDPNQPSAGQTSPVAVAGLLAAAGAGGGLLLNNLTDLGEEAVKGNILEVRVGPGLGQAGACAQRMKYAVIAQF